MTDIRNILERSSARETAMRVAVGAVAKRLLDEFGISITSHVIAIGGVHAKGEKLSFKEIRKRAEASELRCADHAREADDAPDRRGGAGGDSLGGIYEVIVSGVPVGLGSHVHWDRKLDARLAAALMSIQAMKGVEVGSGFGVANKPGSQVARRDLLGPKGGFFRRTNHAAASRAHVERRGHHAPSGHETHPDPHEAAPLRGPGQQEAFQGCGGAFRRLRRPAAAVVGEAVTAFEIASALTDKFGGDSLDEMKAEP